MRALVAMAFALAVAVPLSGCLDCRPQLDVRWCLAGQSGCVPEPDDRVADWNPDVASVFPDVARLLETVKPGKHLHADWTEEQAQAFWEFWQVPAHEPQVFLRHEDKLYRVRVLTC